MDTTDQQAVTVAQLLPCPFCGNPQPQWVGSGAGNYVECGSCLATMPPHDDDVPGETDRWNTRLASVSSASAEELCKRVFLHAHSDGWTGNQMRRDVQHVDAEKSWSLYVSNGALAKSVDAATPEPVPTTDDILSPLPDASLFMPSGPYYLNESQRGGWFQQDSTQPATSQEGEETTCERCDRGVCVNPHYEDDDRLNRPAATPTPPSLSEDLREAISPQQVEEMEDRCRFLQNEIIRCNKVIDEGKGDSWWHQDRDRFQQELRDLRAALAQVKAS